MKKSNLNPIISYIKKPPKKIIKTTKKLSDIKKQIEDIKDKEFKNDFNGLLNDIFN